MISRDQRRIVLEALRALDKRRFVLAIHDAAFPEDARDLDAGRGTPYGHGGAAFTELVARLGFDGLQLGPQGETSAVNASPYDGTAFSRSTLSVALGSLVDDEAWRGLVTRDEVEALTRGRPRGRPDRVARDHARGAVRGALALAASRLGARAELGARFDRFARESASWLEPDARYEALEAEHGFDWRRWPATPSGEVLVRRRGLVDEYRLGQWVVHEQHRRFREQARALGLVLLADLQVGVSARDEWAHQDAFVPGYLLGAPPSRTNPAGQPWGYPVLDPLAPAARALLLARISKLLDEADGIRIDHPHGLVCPWVYRREAGDSIGALNQGTRLRASPDLADHPALVAYAVPRPEQLDRALPRHAEGWVRGLDPEQVDRYAVLFDAVVDAVRRRGLDVQDLACEILSTCPRPVAEVLARHGLGRFRVTEKANVLDPHDPYLGETARPADWIMLATHDTPPIWATVDRWRGTPELERRVAYLARRLAPEPSQRAAFARAIVERPGRLPQAMLAEAFASPARNVSMYFTDLLGIKEPYNVPGTVDDDNWSLRVPADFERLYEERLARGEALDIPLALAVALRARGAPEHAGLIARLEGVSRGAPTPPTRGIPFGG